MWDRNLGELYSVLKHNFAATLSPRVPCEGPNVPTDVLSVLLCGYESLDITEKGITSYTDFFELPRV